VAGNKKELFTPTRFMLPTSHYDEKRAQFVIDFIQNLRHTKGEWFNKPFFLLDWQLQIIKNIFGVIKEDGYRQFLNSICRNRQEAR
jgi:phage terminase large subunit-like protein